MNILDQSKEITLRELYFHYHSLALSINKIFIEKGFGLNSNIIIPFNRGYCNHLSSVLKDMTEFKYSGTMIRPSDVGGDLHKENFPWDDFKEVSDINDLKEFIQYFKVKDNFDKIAYDINASPW